MLRRHVLLLAPIDGDAERQGVAHVAEHSTAVLTPAPGALDADALGRLRELDPGGQGRLVERVLKTYLASLDKLLPSLDQARFANNWPVIRQIAHTLKSSSASIGALAMSDLCREIEQAVRDGQLGCVPSLLTELDAEVDRVRRTLERTIETGQP
jgi:HPt (histidine-containing phosphotransfer) domain-containing protein